MFLFLRSPITLILSLDIQIKRYEKPVVEVVKASPIAGRLIFASLAPLATSHSFVGQSLVEEDSNKNEFRTADEKKRKDREGRAEENPKLKKRKVDALVGADVPTPEPNEKVLILIL